MSWSTWWQEVFGGRGEVLGINRRNLEFVFADYTPGKFRDLDDKLISKERLTAVGAAVPATLSVIRTAADLSSIPELLQQPRDLVLKPARGYGGRGILVVARTEDGWCRASGRPISADEIVLHAHGILAGLHSLDESDDVCLIEERIESHEFFHALYQHGLADIRVVFHGGQPLQAMCRVPTSLSDGKANLHGGAIGLGVVLTTGELTGGIHAGQSVRTHPDSGASLVGARIPLWDECIELARLAATAVDVEYVGVDIVLDARRGPVVLEVNARPGLAIQLANDQGQPVPPRAAMTRIERMTFGVAWLLLAALAIGFGFSDSLLTRDDASLRYQLSAADTNDDSAASVQPGSQWAYEESSLSEESNHFRQARAALANGDTLQALDIYVAATADTSLAPFALNNVALIQRGRGQLIEARRSLEAAVNTYPSYARGRYNLGLVLEEMEQPHAAREQYDQVLALRPSHARAWHQLAGIHYGNDDFTAAATAYEQEIRFSPGSKYGWLRLGLTQRRLGLHEDATQSFATMHRLDPADEAGVYWWARSTMDMPPDGQTKAIRDSLVGELRPFAEADAPSLRCRSVLGDLHWGLGAWSEARDVFQGLVDERYRRGTHRRRLAAVLVDLGLTEAARNILPKLDDSDPVRGREMGTVDWLAFVQDAAAEEDVRTHDVFSRDEPLSNAYLESLRLAWNGNLRRADSHWQASESTPDLAVSLASWVRASESDDGITPEWGVLVESQLRAGLRARVDGDVPGPAVLLWAWARMATALGRLDMATEIQRHIDEKFPHFQPGARARFFAQVESGDNKAARRTGRGLLLARNDSEVRLALVRLSLDADRPREARGLFDALPATQIDQLESQLLLARIHAATNSPRRAISVLEKLRRRAPSDARVRQQLGAQYAAQGKARSAIRELTHAVELMPTDVEVRQLLAHQLMDAREYEQAVLHWERVVRFPGSSTIDRFNLALSLQRSDRFEEAIIEYDRLLELDPERYKTRFNRGLALEKLGRIDEARAEFERVLQTEPNHEPSRNRLAVLETLR